MSTLSKPYILAVAIISAASAATVNAQVTASIGGEAQSGANYVNFDTLTPGSSATYNSGALSVVFGGNASAFAGTHTFPGHTGGASEPWLSGNNNVFFESPSTLPALGRGDTTTYIDAGDAADGGKITFNFSSPESYFGAVVGSVDAANSFQFYSGPNGTGTLLETVSGGDLYTDAGLTSYDQTGLGGTVYMNVDAASDFESVVATTDIPTLEIDNVAYGNAGVPDAGATMGLLGGALACLGAIRRKLAR